MDNGYRYDYRWYLHTKDMMMVIILIIVVLLLLFIFFLLPFGLSLLRSVVQFEIYLFLFFSFDWMTFFVAPFSHIKCIRVRFFFLLVFDQISFCRLLVFYSFVIFFESKWNQKMNHLKGLTNVYQTKWNQMKNKNYEHPLVCWPNVQISWNLY